MRGGGWGRTLQGQRQDAKWGLQHQKGYARVGNLHARKGRGGKLPLRAWERCAGAGAGGGQKGKGMKWSSEHWEGCVGQGLPLASS